MESAIHDQLLKRYAEKEELIGPELMREMERVIMLNVIDNQWKDHLLSMDHLKEGIGMRAYGQKDPLIEYKKESFVLFQDMMDRIEDEAVRFLFFMQRSDGDGRGPQGATAGERAASRALGRGRGRRAGAGACYRRRRRSEDHRRAQQAAQNSVMDLTRTIQRKKEKELAALQFVGGDTDHRAKAGDRERQRRRTQRPLPLRKREEVQKMPRSLKTKMGQTTFSSSAGVLSPRP